MSCAATFLDSSVLPSLVLPRSRNCGCQPDSYRSTPAELACRPWWRKSSPDRWSIPVLAYAPVLLPDSAVPVPADTHAQCDGPGPLPPTVPVESDFLWQRSPPRSCHPLTDVPLHQSHFHTLLHDLFKQLLEQLRFLKPSMPVFRKRRVMRNLLIKAETGEPAPRQMHAQFLHQFAFAGDAVQITDQQNAQQQLGVNRGAAGLAVAVFQLLPYKPAEGGLEPVPVDRFRGAYPHQLSSYALLSLSAFRARGARLSATLPLPDYGRVARNSEVIRGPVAKGMISKGVADV